MIEMIDVSSFLYTDLNQQINVSGLIFINLFVTENYFSWSHFFPDRFIYIFCCSYHSEKFFLSYFGTIEQAWSMYMEKMLFTNSKKTLQYYQCELNFEAPGIDIGECASLRVYSGHFLIAKDKELIQDHRHFKIHSFDWLSSH